MSEKQYSLIGSEIRRYY